MDKMDHSDQSCHRNSESADRRNLLPARTAIGAIEARDDDMVMVGADGLQLFELETGADVDDPATPREQLPWLKLCLPVALSGCETLSVYLNCDEPEVEVELFRTVFLPAHRTRTQPPTLEKLTNEIVAFHTASVFILAATSTHAACRAAIMGSTKSVKGASLIAWMHVSVLYRHQARALAAVPNLRRTLPGMQAITSAACQILRGCEIPRPTGEAAHNNDFHSGDASEIAEIVSMTRKGRHTDDGAGTVHVHWTGAAPSTDAAPSVKIRDVYDRLDQALLVVDFGDLEMPVTIEKNLHHAFTQLLSDLLRTSSRDGRISAMAMQSLYQAILLHHEASSKHSFSGSAQDHAEDVACYILNQWHERYQNHQKDADLAEHAVFLNAVFELAGRIDIQYQVRWASEYPRGAWTSWLREEVVRRRVWLESEACYCR